jgi:Pyridoxamine 5'-phosphate oxidase
MYHEGRTSVLCVSCAWARSTIESITISGENAAKSTEQKGEREQGMTSKMKEPTTELHPQYSSEEATPTSWAYARGQLEEASIYWLATVRPNGHPHVTPLFAVWLDERLYFCTGPGERKAKNLAGNPHCVITTGCNVIEGVDIVLEGEAVQVSEEDTLQHVAGRYASKYGWHYEVRDGAFHGEGGRALVYKVIPTTAFGFGKGDTFSQTRWRF